ncbi:histidine kinase [Belliella baltica]|uniref:histidine kinase n=1 Tax=Belliella baltica TaxID=232259 RepID=UPI0002FB0670|nr:histidine kinase [Belliella baltica]
MPGTANVGNDGRLFVRGGDASETTIFIDGMKVANAFGTTASNVPTRTRFNPNLFKGSFFSTGGYSAEYGQALSSALALNTVDIPLRNQGDVSIMSIGGGFAQTLTSEKNSITASANYFDLSPYQSLINQDFDWERAPFGWDAEIAAKQKWGKNGMAKAYVHTESSGMKIWNKQPDSEDRGQLVDVSNKYTFAQSSFKQVGKNDWSYYGGFSYSNNIDDFNIATDEIRNQNKLYHGKMVAIKSFSDKFSIKTGLESYMTRYSEQLISQDLKREISDNQYNLFTEADYYLSNKLVFRGGLRSGHSSLANQTWLDPRFSLAYKFENEGQVSLAAGTFSQMPLEELRIINPALQNTKAEHLILNYFINKNGRTIRAEAFYKGYNNLITFEGQRYNYQKIEQTGEGFAQGFDFFYRDQKSIKNTDFWITYSFIDSKRQFAMFTQMVQPSFAPRQNALMPTGIEVIIITIFIARSWLFEWKIAAIEAEKLKSENIASQYQSLKDQLNPHFLFNSLNVLSNLVYESADKSAEFIQQLSRIYRYVLDVQDEELVSLEMEIDFALNYLSLQKIRFEQSLEFHIDVFESKEWSIPPLSLQLLLENAIKHNVTSVTKPLKIWIGIENQKLIVKNNIQPKLNKKANSGIGLNNITKRYNLLSETSPEITQTEKEFIVKLPLLKVSK